MSEKVVVAMSGGVDSSVAALLLHEQGYEVVGVSMQVWDYRNNGGCASRATCCAPDDFADARSVAQRIGVPYYVFDFEENFHREVIDRFVQTYAEGRTPNPCIDCNSRVKFRELRNRAKSLGYRHVATGHYAVIQQDTDGYRLYRGDDPAKDQSYFLYNLNQQELSETLFPIGNFTKAEVRALADKAGLATAEKPESQDICFVSGSLDQFVRSRLAVIRSGPIERRDGTVLGQHEGIHQYTVGQRKGLGVGGQEEPLYVLAIEPGRNAVIVGTADELELRSFAVRELHWVSPDFTARVESDFTFPAIAQIRHRHRGVPVEVTVSGDHAVVTFQEEWSAVSPGQAAVFYDLENRELFGGGRIEGAL